MLAKVSIANRGRAASGTNKVAALTGMFLLVGDAEPAAEPRFAIRCTGTAQFTDNVLGRGNSRRYELPPQVYVLAPASRQVQRALEPRQEFEDICFRDGNIDSRSFSPGLIVVRSEAPGRLCEFTVDRAIGEGGYLSHEDLPGGRFSRVEFDMQCEAAQIPIFDSSRNRF